MNTFTKKEFDKLKGLEAHLTRGYYGRYIYALRRPDFDKMIEVYKHLGYTKKMEYSCSSCLLELTSTLGRLYFEYKKKQDEKKVSKSAEKTE